MLKLLKATWLINDRFEIFNPDLLNPSTEPIHSINVYNYYMPDTVTGLGDTAVNKTERKKRSCSHGAYILEREERRNQQI